MERIACETWGRCEPKAARAHPTQPPRARAATEEPPSVDDTTQSQPQSGVQASASAASASSASSEQDLWNTTSPHVRVVHKKIRLSDEHLAWEHEIFSLKRAPFQAITLSALGVGAHDSAPRGSLLDGYHCLYTYTLHTHYLNSAGH